MIIATEVAARFASVYSQRKSSYVLRSARVLGALGYSIEVFEPGEGISGRGTTEESLYSEDVLRKLLGKLEQEAKISDEDRAAAQPGGAEVKVRERKSRRAVKQENLDEQEAAVRSHSVGWSCALGITNQLGLGCSSMRGQARGAGFTFSTRRGLKWRWRVATMNAAGWCGMMMGSCIAVTNWRVFGNYPHSPSPFSNHSLGT